ncbi:MAG: hypothetical protein K9L75_06590 [Spirochaetia bacterium]|nr:hypothetical protein [Spirochaetia bacterium]
MDNEVKNVLLGGWITSKANTIKSGDTVVKGAVLSQRKSAGAAAEGSENTGDGTVDAIAIGPKAVVGTYKLVCISASADGGRFNVISPRGHSCGVANVGEAFVSGELNLTVNDGAEDFVLGDEFTIPVTGLGTWKLVNSADDEGAGTAEMIQMLDVDASEGDTQSSGWVSGEFDSSLLNVGGTDTVDQHAEELKERGMLLIDTVGGNY